jgi:hypothetical protein
MMVFTDLGDSGIEGSFLFESIALPQFGDLTDDLLAAGISFPLFDGGWKRYMMQWICRPEVLFTFCGFI